MSAGCTLVSGNCPPSVPPAPHVRYEPVAWSALPGWTADQLPDAWPAFLDSCSVLGARPEWQSICTEARNLDPRTADLHEFFEQHFEAYSVQSETGRRREATGLVTGYYEPLLQGSRTRSDRFGTPLYSPPPDLLTVDLAALYPELKGKRVRARVVGNRVVPYYSRADLRQDVSLAGHELVWIDGALNAFLLEVQGSGRVQLDDGETIRVEYADQNGQPYRSIGRYLVDAHELTLDQATMPGIRAWAEAHPDRIDELLNANPSVVFFREAPVGDPNEGPRGALGVPLTAGRSVAVDPASIPLGAPAFLATPLRPPASAPGASADKQGSGGQAATGTALQRLVMAQDTGGAIHGPVRADFFWGTGASAGAAAGQMRELGRIWLLWPKGYALPAR
jgi:membrane-bound lytic murein transglycosylase A